VPRLTTFKTNFHKFILAERNTHRSFSRSDRSSRAVPTLNLIEEVKQDPAMPVEFRRAQKGMSGGELLTGAALEIAQIGWREAAAAASAYCKGAYERGEAKETTNRYIDTFVYTHSVMTSCEPGLLNFFGLRLDKGAQPEIRVLAEKMWAAWNESKPKQLNPGQWHLPFIDQQTVDEAAVHYALLDEERQSGLRLMFSDPLTRLLIMISAARCGRTSYNSFETNRRSIIEEDLRLYDRFAASAPLHLGPLEHQAIPDVFHREDAPYRWENPELHGNLPGWRQWRKYIPDEAVASLPDEYKYIR
jgi:thymidylate synthase ThyX